MKVLDACALIAFFQNEEGCDIVENILLNEDCVIHAINICEVYYDLLKRNKELPERHIKADVMIEDIKKAAVTIKSDLEEDLWKQAGNIKAKNKIPLPDCIALALAKKLNATLCSADHTDFDSLKDECSIEFIR
jgi:predicted nucleic acid-binding protein